MAHAISETLGDAHHHSVGTLSRDTDDTVRFHTNLNAVHTTQPPTTPHPPGPAPVLPATPWHHTSHWVEIDPQKSRKPVVHSANNGSAAGGPIPAEWNFELTWPVHRLSSADTAARGSWLVVANAELGAEVRRAVGGDSRVTVLAPGDDEALLAAVADAENVMYAPGCCARPVGRGGGLPAVQRGAALVNGIGGDCRTSRNCSCSPETPNRSRRATGPTRLMRCCGDLAAPWRWNTPRSGAASSMSTSRCLRTGPLATFSPRLRRLRAKTRLSIAQECVTCRAS